MLNLSGITEKRVEWGIMFKTGFEKIAKQDESKKHKAMAAGGSGLALAGYLGKRPLYRKQTHAKIDLDSVEKKKNILARGLKERRKVIIDAELNYRPLLKRLNSEKIRTQARKKSNQTALKELQDLRDQKRQMLSQYQINKNTAQKNLSRAKLKVNAARATILGGAGLGLYGAKKLYDKHKLNKNTN